MGGANFNLIGRGTVMIGSITASSSVRIEGEVKGKVVCHDLVTIGSSGAIEGDVDAKNLVVGGRVLGNVSAQEKLVMEAQSSVTGDIRAKKLVVQEGASFDGRCSMKETKDKSMTMADAPKENELKIVKG